MQKCSSRPVLVASWPTAVGVLSVPEGDEKVRKYPALFVRADVVVINKIDLLEHCPYDVARVREDCRRARPDTKVFEVSATEGTGFDPWLAFLAENTRSARSRPNGA